MCCVIQTCVSLSWWITSFNYEHLCCLVCFLMTQRLYHQSFIDTSKTWFYYFFYYILLIIYWVVTCLPFHVGAVSPLACTEEVESATAVGERRPCGWSEAEGGTHAVFHPAEIFVQAKDLSGLPEGRVLLGDAAERTVNTALHCTGFINI